MMNDDIAIRVNHLTKVYKLYDKPSDRLREALNPFKKSYHKDFYALNDVSFEIKKGETVGIIGKNGAGKSTLLKIITGVLTPSSGDVQVNGRIASLLELGAGFNPEYTGLENIYLQGTLMGLSHEEMEPKVADILAFADIGDFINQPVKSYSSGMFARLAFAVAINVDPDILIVDEALSVGDAAFQAKCFNKFKEFQQQKKTILFVTHSLDLIIKYCQSAILIHQGQMVLQGDVKTTTEQYRKYLVAVDGKEEDAGTRDAIVDNDAQQSGFLALDKKADSYGGMEAEIIGFSIFNHEGKLTTHVYHDEKYTILIKVKFHEDIVDPIVAYTLRSVDGMELTGTNTNNENLVFGSVRKGTVITVKFEQVMILNSGTYLLALGCTKYDNDSLRVFHRIYDATAIEVSSPRKATGIAFSPSSIFVERE